MWVKLDDQDAESEAIRAVFAARPGPLALHHRALLYAGQQLTDGRVDRLLVEQWLPRPAQRKQCVGPLVEHGFWSELEHRSGWEIVDFLKTNPSRDQVLSERESEARRKSLQRNPSLREAVRRRDGDTCRYCAREVTFTEKHLGHGATFDLIDPGGEITLQNVVLCCRRCNVEKGSLMLEEAGMQLLSPPLLEAFSQPSSSRCPSGHRSGRPDSRAADVRTPRPDPTRPELKAFR